jgi:predicted metal-binding protein
MVIGDGMILKNDGDTLEPLVDLALGSGTTAAAVIPAGEISAEDALALLCRQPRCRNYGLSMSCPPHVAGPPHFRALVTAYREALVVKIDVPTKILLSDSRREIMQLLHEIVSGVERSAIAMGFDNARAFAGGGCKEIFCRDHRHCRALSGAGDCRNPRLARPSMSGFGINVSKLVQTAGWSGKTIVQSGKAPPPSMSWVAGLVLVR